MRTFFIAANAVAAVGNAIVVYSFALRHAPPLLLGAATMVGALNGLVAGLLYEQGRHQ